MLHHYLAKDVGRLFVCSFVSVIRRNVANSAAVPATKDAIRYLGCDGENNYDVSAGILLVAKATQVITELLLQL